MMMLFREVGGNFVFVEYIYYFFLVRVLVFLYYFGFYLLKINLEIFYDIILFVFIFFNCFL